MDHDQIIKSQFARQASAFSQPGLTLSSREYLDWIVGMLPLEPHLRVLDVAAGTGILSRAIASRVGEVVAVDLTPQMLEEARRETAKNGFGNIRIQEGDAARLSFRDDSFDLVVTRLSIHHFERPEVQLREMVRVCKRGCSVCVIDLLSPDDESVREEYNRLERLRDPSHAIAMTAAQLASAMEQAGLSGLFMDTRDIAVDFDQWAAMTGTTPETRGLIREQLEGDIRGTVRTGMRPFRENGRLKFTQTWAVVIGSKR